MNTSLGLLFLKLVLQRIYLIIAFSDYFLQHRVVMRILTIDLDKARIYVSNYRVRLFFT